MALIKCSECGKEISDKALECPHCGCPQEKMDTYCIECGKKIKNDDKVCPNCGCPKNPEETSPKKKVKTKGKKTKFMTVWLIICACVCFQIVPITFLGAMVAQSNLTLYILGYLAGILGVNYLMLNKHTTLLNYILLLVTNFLIFVLAIFLPYDNGITFASINLLKAGPIICVLLNVALTTAFISKGLHNEKAKFLEYLALIITTGVGVIALIIGLIIANANNIYGTYYQIGGADAVIDIYHNNRCEVYLNDSEDYYTETSSCYWYLNDDELTIEFDMTLRNNYTSYTDKVTLEGTLYKNKFVTDGGATYYKD